MKMILSLDLLSKIHSSTWNYHFNVEKIFQGIKPLSLPGAQNCPYDQHFADVRGELLTV